jgi:hypothetical protein
MRHGEHGDGRNQGNRGAGKPQRARAADTEAIGFMRRIHQGNGIGFRQPAVAPGRYGLDELRAPGIVAERLAQLRDNAREGVVRDRRVRPDTVEDLLLGDNVRARLDEQNEDVERLGLELDWAPRTIDAKRGEIDAQRPERVPAPRTCHFDLTN